MSSRVNRRTRRGRGAVLAASLALLTVAGPGTQAAHAGLVDGLLGTTTSVLGGLTAPLLGGSDWAYTAEATSVQDATTAIRADAVWRAGWTGKGVGVALVDTGVVPVEGLTSGNVVDGPDLSFESQSADARHLDSFGHGTHMAGIIAGRDSTSGRGFRGVAPDATLVSVKIGGYDGAVDVSQVIAAVDWAVQHRAEHNLRVLNLSYGTDGQQLYTSDPLAHAVENAWRAGLVVVVSGGNAGSGQERVDNPASDPYVLAVGADDLLGTSAADNDVVPAFSTRGSAARRVDLVAPGQSIASLRNPGSFIDQTYPEAAVDSRYFKGSGTSQAAAVVSGAAALLLQQRPELTPDQVKRLLTSTAVPLRQSDAAGQGAGLLNVLAASRAATPAAVQTYARSTGLGTLEGARGSHHVSDGDAELTGEQDIFGQAWQPSLWAPASAAGRSWAQGTWNGSVWSGSCWCGSSWSGSSWTGAAWTSKSWNGQDWSSTGWNSKSWNGSAWTGRSWTSKSWNGSSWSGTAP
jgi:serine protease AprX